MGFNSGFKGLTFQKISQSSDFKMGYQVPGAYGKST